MPKRSDGEKKIGGISDVAVLKRTGKNWTQWCKLLDKAGAKKWSHPEIAVYLKKKCGLSGWWSQMVTVGYEQARGRREKYQRASGYSSNVSKTVAVPLKRLYEAWEDARVRATWLGEQQLNIRKATPNKSMRITCSDGKTNLEVNFSAKGAAKSLVAVEHAKLKNLQAVERSRAFWQRALGALKTRLES